MAAAVVVVVTVAVAVAVAAVAAGVAAEVVAVAVAVVAVVSTVEALCCQPWQKMQERYENFHGYPSPIGLQCSRIYLVCYA